MKFNYRVFLMTLVSALTLLTVSACSEGTGEKTGEKIDEMITDSKNKIEDTCEQVKSEMDMKDTDC